MYPNEAPGTNPTAVQAGRQAGKEGEKELGEEWTAPFGAETETVFGRRGRRPAHPPNPTIMLSRIGGWANKTKVKTNFLVVEVVTPKSKDTGKRFVSRRRSQRIFFFRFFFS